MTSAYARSRCGPGAPSRAGKPSLRAIACTAAACPCGSDRVTSNAASASMSVAPASTARIAVIASGGRCDRFARVSLRTLPPSRNERRSRCRS